MPRISNPAQAEQYSDLLKAGLDVVFEDDLPTHEKLFSGWLPSSPIKEFREDGIVTTGLGAMPEKEIGGAFIVDKPYISSQKEFTLRTWGLGFVAEHELIYWELYGIFDDMTRELAKSAVDRCNILAYSVLNNSFSAPSAVYQIYNGENIFSTSHALLGGGTFSNRSATNAALSYTALQVGRTSFMRAVNERGIYVRLMPSNLIVPPDNEWYAQTLLQSTLRPGTADNDKNVLPSFSIDGSSPYITSTTAWWLLANKSTLARRKSFRFRQGEEPHTRKDFDHSTWNSTISCYQSNRVEILHYQGSYGSDGSGS